MHLSLAETTTAAQPDVDPANRHGMHVAQERDPNNRRGFAGISPTRVERRQGPRRAADREPKTSVIKRLILQSRNSLETFISRLSAWKAEIAALGQLRVQKVSHITPESPLALVNTNQETSPPVSSSVEEETRDNPEIAAQLQLIDERMLSIQSRLQELLAELKDLKRGEARMDVQAEEGFGISTGMPSRSPFS